MCLWENTFANEGFVVPPFLSGSPRNLCFDIALSLHFDSQQSFSREFKSYSAALPVNTATVIIDLANIFPSFNTSTAKDGV